MQASHAQQRPEETTHLGLAVGFRHFLIRDELQSFRNFYGGGVPVGFVLTQRKKLTVFDLNASAVWANLESSRSAMELKTFVSNVDMAYTWELKRKSGTKATWMGGPRLTSQLSARTYDFNSPIGGQDPFTGEFFLAPGGVARVSRALLPKLSLSWQLGWSPLAYLFSRDYHPIRDFQYFGDVPRGVVAANRFSDISSELAGILEAGNRAHLRLSYRWRYLYYRRVYTFQAASHEITVGLTFKTGR